MLYQLTKAVVAPAALALWRPRVTGRENVPLAGPVVLASNHLSFIDSVVIPLVAPRPVAFLAKDSYFTGTTPAARLMATWFRAMGAIPVDRDDPSAAKKALEAQLEVLRGGGACGIYPEGTRSRDGRLYRGHTGVAHLALQTGAPIVPIGLRGTQDIQPVGARLPRLARVEVRFGQPVPVAGRFEGVPAGRARRELTEEVMAAVHALSGQELAGEYNARAPRS